MTSSQGTGQIRMVKRRFKIGSEGRLQRWDLYGVVVGATSGDCANCLLPFLLALTEQVAREILVITPDQAQPIIK